MEGRREEGMDGRSEGARDEGMEGEKKAHTHAYTHSIVFKSNIYKSVMVHSRRLQWQQELDMVVGYSLHRKIHRCYCMIPVEIRKLKKSYMYTDCAFEKNIQKFNHKILTY